MTTQHAAKAPELTRRTLLAAAVCALCGCGGGGSADPTAPSGTPIGGGGSGGSGGGLGIGGSGSSQGSTHVAGLPGTGGTGVTSFGTISAFGSVVVNGIHYDETQAQIQVDGLSAVPSALRLGMVATVKGTRDAAALTGVAERIDVWSIAQGDIASAVAQGGGVLFSVGNLDVVADAGTLLEGVSNLSDLRPGVRVTVWGLQTDASAMQWLATRVAVTNSPQWVITGVLTGLEHAAQVNGWRLVGEVPDALKPGQLVRAEGTVSAQANTLTLGRIVSLDYSTQLAHGEEIEIEGVITQPPQAGRFHIGPIAIDGSSLPLTASLTAGMEIEVKGTFSNGVLVAREIEIENHGRPNELELKARIDQFTSVSNFVMRGQRCDASGVQTVKGGRLSDLRSGVKVKVKGTRSGDTLMVHSIEFDD